MAAKNNVDWYAHRSHSHNDWRFKTLRRKYSWSGEGRFYALVSMIGSEDDCKLYLDSEEKLYQYAADLDMDAEELREFLEYLVKPCKLLLRDEDGALRWEETDRALEEVSAKRKRQREWKREKSTGAKTPELPESRPSTAAESTVETPLRRGERVEESRGELESLQKNQSLQDSLSAEDADREKTEEVDKGKQSITPPLSTTPEPGPAPGNQGAAPPRSANGKFVSKTGGNSQKSKEKRPFWQNFVQAWYDHHMSTGREEPSFVGRDPKYLGELYDRFQLRSQRKAPPVPWTEETSASALKSYLSAAELHTWLAQNFQLKYLVEKFDTVLNLAKDGASVSGPRTNYEQEVKIFYRAYCSGKLEPRAIKADHYPPLADLHPVSENLLERAKQIRATKLQGTNDGHLLRVMEAYQAGDDNADTAADLPVVLGMARRLAVLEYFEMCKAAGKPEILATNPPQLKAV